MTTRSSAVGTRGLIVRGGEGVSLRIARKTADGVSPLNARRPVTISYNIAPNENRSDRASTGSPRACSGDMYGAVPRIAPGVEVVTDGASATEPALPSSRSTPFANPKSSSFTNPVAVTLMLAGFKSR